MLNWKKWLLPIVIRASLVLIAGVFTALAVINDEAKDKGMYDKEWYHGHASRGGQHGHGGHGRFHKEPSHEVSIEHQTEDDLHAALEAKDAAKIKTALAAVLKPLQANNKQMKQEIADVKAATN